MLSDNEIIEGIASNNNSVLRFVYKEMYPFVESYVIQHGGTSDQAQDVFQEALIVIFRKISAEKLSLQCKFSTYLYAICKRIWIQERKKEYLRTNKLNEISSLAEAAIHYGQETIDEARELFEKHFRKISADCQKILQMYFNGLTIEEIRDVMEFNTLHNAIDKKYRCKKKLIDRIKGDPLFRKFKK